MEVLQYLKNLKEKEAKLKKEMEELEKATKDYEEYKIQYNNNPVIKEFDALLEKKYAKPVREEIVVDSNFKYENKINSLPPEERKTVYFETDLDNRIRCYYIKTYYFDNDYYSIKEQYPDLIKKYDELDKIKKSKWRFINSLESSIRYTKLTIADLKHSIVNSSQKFIRTRLGFNVDNCHYIIAKDGKNIYSYPKSQEELELEKNYLLNKTNESLKEGEIDQSEKEDLVKNIDILYDEFTKEISNEEIEEVYVKKAKLLKQIDDLYDDLDELEEKKKSYSTNEEYSYNKALIELELLKLQGSVLCFNKDIKIKRINKVSSHYSPPYLNQYKTVTCFESDIDLFENSVDINKKEQVINVLEGQLGKKTEEEVKIRNQELTENIIETKQDIRELKRDKNIATARMIKGKLDYYKLIKHISDETYNELLGELRNINKNGTSYTDLEEKITSTSFYEKPNKSR